MNIGPLSSKQPRRAAWTTERLLHERAVALGCALEPNSVATYSSAFQSYLTFCTSHHRSFEPTIETLTFYIVYMCHHIKPQSVKTYLSGICNQLEPFYPDVRGLRRHRLVTKTLAGCTKIRAVGVLRKRPLTRNDLSVVCATLTPTSSHDDILFASMLLIGFNALMRLGEFVWPDNKKLQDYRKVTMRHTVEFFPAGFSFFLPTHKGDRLFEGNRVLVQETTTADDPFSIFKRYLKSRDHLFPFNPELWLRVDGSIPRRSWFIRQLQSFFVDDVGGHSIRSGGATALAEAGVPPHIIQAIGRWASDTFQIYIRRHPVLLAALLFGRRGI
jgi:hypothetical protein